MNIKKIINHLEKVAPLNYQESYDNSGLIVGSSDKEVKRILICLDITEEVIDEAIGLKTDLIISHHPIIFLGIRKITGSTYVQRVILKAIEKNIALYAMHTNLDNVLKGVNAKICEKLGLTKCKILLPGDTRNTGAGMIGELRSSTDSLQFIKKIKKIMKVGVIRHTELVKKRIKRVAVCGGSGSFLLQDAIKKKADIFISADFKYHQFFDSENKIIIADIGHYESEQFTMELVKEILTPLAAVKRKKIVNFAARITNINTNPIIYS